MKKVIVNADDFGLTEGVNRAIIDGHRNGIITSTTLMANGMAFDSAIAATSTAPNLGVGVHLNLTQGQPVCTSSLVSSILTSAGSFYPTPEILALRVLAQRARLRDVESELRSQIEKVASAGIRITHLDSHKHIHLLPPIFDVVVKLAREYEIGCVRCPMEPVPSVLGFLRSGGRAWSQMIKQCFLGRAISILAARQVNKLENAKLCWPERFYGLSQTGFLNGATLEKILRAVPEGTSEVMCHPGYVDAALLEIRTRLRVQREAELDALTSPAVRQLAAGLGIELISYSGLTSTRGRAARKGNEPVQEAIRKG